MTYGRLRQRYHTQAAIDGTRIIPCCGFDSVPSDLGTYLLVRHLQQELGVNCTEVKAYYQAAGGFNGGTLASGLSIFDRGELNQVSQTFLLNPPEYIPIDLEPHRDPISPQYDKNIGTWVAPFFMGAVNTRIVRRSCALSEQYREPYGMSFSYQEYLKFDAPWAWLQSVGMVAGLAVVAGVIQVPWLRPFLQSIIPQPGSGPTEEKMDEGWFRCELLGWGSEGQRVRSKPIDLPQSKRYNLTKAGFDTN